MCVCVCVLCTFRKTTIVTWYSHTEMPMLLMSYSYFKLLPFNNSGSPFVMLGTKLGPWRLWHPNLSVSCHRISLQCMNIHVHGENTASQAQHSRSQHSTPCVWMHHYSLTADVPASCSRLWQLTSIPCYRSRNPYKMETWLLWIGLTSTKFYVVTDVTCKSFKVPGIADLSSWKYLTACSSLQYLF